MQLIEQYHGLKITSQTTPHRPKLLHKSFLPMTKAFRSEFSNSCGGFKGLKYLDKVEIKYTAFKNSLKDTLCMM